MGRNCQIELSVQPSVLGHVVRTDVDGGIGGLFHELDAGCFGTGYGDYFDNQLLTDALYHELSKETFWEKLDSY